MKLSILFLYFISYSSWAFIPRTFKASFREERVGVLSKKKITHSGIIEYKYPSRLRFEVEGPIKTILVIGSKKTWHYTAPFIEGEKGELKITSTKKQSLGKIFDSINGGLKSNKHYKVQKKGMNYELTFTKALSRDTGVKKVHLVFKDSPVFQSLKKMRIFYAKKSKLYIFKNIQANLALTPQRFRFHPPQGTNVTFL